MATGGVYHNGDFFDHGHAEIDFSGTVYLGIDSANYKDAASSEYVYGTDGFPLGTTRGQYKPDGDVTMLKSEFQRLQAKLPEEMGTARFNVGILLKATGLTTSKDELLGCKIIGIDDTTSQGSKAIMVKLTLQITGGIKRNGKWLMRPKKGGALAVRQG